jgi:hypothetical protein
MHDIFGLKDDDADNNDSSEDGEDGEALFGLVWTRGPG